MPIDYVKIIREESGRFSEALHSTPPDDPVPSCPEWDAAELLWHLTEVQEFWGTIVEQRLANPEGMDRAERPAAYEDVHSRFADMTARLTDSLEATDPGEPVWTWSSDRTAGFVSRRQAHEALIHRADAELTAGRPVTPSSVAMAVDGIDELVTLFIDVPDWGDFAPEGGLVAIAPTDTDDRWVLQLGTFSGTSTTSGKSYEGLTAARVVHEPADATVSGTASDLNFWLWGRTDQVAVSGDAAAVDALRALVAESTQ